MPYYIFNFKKGDLSLEFESTDHRFVAYQMDKWIEEVAGITLLDSRPAKKSSKTIKTKPEKPAKKIVKEEDIEVITENQPSDAVEELEKQVESAIKATQNIIKDTTEIEQTLKKPDFDSFDRTIPDITGIVGELPDADKKEETSALDINEKAQNNKFYKILQEKFSSLPEMVQSNLAKTISEQAEKTKPLESASIEELIELKDPQTPLDYLVVAAYYLKEYDMLDRYSLKQINSKIIRFVQKPVNHTVIQEAVTNNFLEVVPDYTGMADVTEYMITSEGINYIINEM